MGYTAWAAGAFSPIDYNLTVTPKGSAGNFTDQKTLSQCVVGTRNGNSNSTTTSPGSSSMPVPAASTRLAAGGGALVAIVVALAVL